MNAKTGKKTFLGSLDKLLSTTIEDGVILTNDLGSQYKNPFDALLVLMTSTAILSKALGMSASELSQGMELAYEVFAVVEDPPATLDKGKFNAH